MPATVELYQYYYYEPSLGPLYPGQRRTRWYEFNWRDKSAAATAMPFDAWGKDRKLTVENLSIRTYGIGDPNAPPIQYVQLDVVNTGADAIAIHWVELAVISR